jgi:hypothetical protein
MRRIGRWEVGSLKMPVSTNVETPQNTETKLIKIKIKCQAKNWTSLTKDKLYMNS